jgi:hypothetical protein
MVDNVEHNYPDTWTAEVEGSDLYTVEIKLNNGEIVSWECDCPYDYGDICKHVVAVLLYIRDNKKCHPVNIEIPPSPQQEQDYMALKRCPKNKRLDYELAECIEKWGWKYHHTGIPTNEKKPGERYIPQFKFYVSGFDSSPYGIEWMRFETDSPINKLIQTIPHVAFEVKDLDYELSHRNFKIITEPNPPSEGVRVAMIEHNGAPIELIEFSTK